MCHSVALSSRLLQTPFASRNTNGAPDSLAPSPSDLEKVTDRSINSLCHLRGQFLPHPAAEKDCGGSVPQCSAQFWCRLTAKLRLYPRDAKLSLLAEVWAARDKMLSVLDGPCAAHQAASFLAWCLERGTHPLHEWSSTTTKLQAQQAARMNPATIKPGKVPSSTHPLEDCQRGHARNKQC